MDLTTQNAIDEINILLNSIKDHESIISNISDRLSYIEEKANVIEENHIHSKENELFMELCNSLPEPILDFDWSRVDLNIVNLSKIEDFLETLKNA